VLFYPGLEVGGYSANNYYATNTPNVDVSATTFSLSNNVLFYMSHWLTSEVYISYEEENTDTILENNRSINGSLLLSWSPFNTISFDTTIDYFNYRSDRFDGGNIDLISGSETIYIYFNKYQFISLTGAVNQYDYVKTNKKAEKNKVTLGIQGPADIYISAGLAKLSSQDDISEYEEQTYMISKYVWDFYPMVFDGSAKYSKRKYSSTDSDYLDSKLRLSYYFTTNFKLATSVSYYSEIGTTGQDNIQASISLSYSDLLGGLFNGNAASRTEFIYRDALKSIERRDFIKASHQLDRVIFSDPYHSEALFERALIYHELKDYNAAVSFFKRAIKSDNTLFEAYYLLAYDLIQLNRIIEAKAILELLYEQTNNESVKLYLNQL
tara:strand:- start:2921 stop:4063 length:1143 start_codon:yes stop_codon:yes gene_type:complete